MAPIDGLGERMKRVLIFGARPSGKCAVKAKKDDWQVIAFYDNDADKWGKSIQSIPIYSHDTILSLYFDVVYIASAPEREAIM